MAVTDLTLEQFAALTPSQIAAIPVNEIPTIPDDYVAVMVPAQLNALTADQWAAFDPVVQTNLPKLLDDPTVLAQFTPTAFGRIPAALLSYIRAIVFAAVINAAKVAAMTSAQVAALSTDQTIGFTAASMAGFGAQQIAGLGETQITALETVDVAALTGAQIALLTPQQAAWFPLESYQAISAAAIATQGALSAVFDAAVIGQLFVTQAAAISASATAGFTVEQVQALSPDVISALTPAAVAALAPACIAALTDEQVVMLTPEHFAAMSPAQLAALNVEQIHLLADNSFSLLDAEQGESFTAEQRAAMSPAQLAVIPVYLALTRYQSATRTGTWLFTGAVVDGQIEASATDLIVGVEEGKALYTFLSATYASVAEAREAWAESGADAGGIGVITVSIGLDRENRLKLVLKTLATVGQLRIVLPHSSVE